MKRDSHSSGTPARALEPRQKIRFPCGIIRGGGQSSVFEFGNIQTLRFRWSFGETELNGERVKIKVVNPKGKDRLIKDPRVQDVGIVFIPRLGVPYYI